MEETTWEIKLKRSFKEYDMSVWIRFVWLRIVFRDSIWTCGFHKILGIYRLDEGLRISREILFREVRRKH
jgi:hypothetical protein